MFCPDFLGRKTNLLDFSFKIGTKPSLSWFDQSLGSSCKNSFLSVYVNGATCFDERFLFHVVTRRHHLFIKDYCLSEGFLTTMF